MNKTSLFLATSFISLVACSTLGQEGDECNTDADCADGLECHMHEHDGEVSDHGECEAHEDGDTDHASDTDHAGE